MSTRYTKESLIQKLKEISEKGWILGGRQGNAGGVGNTLEDELGIEENNLPIPNAAEWELKCQRKNTSSLTTLFHMEPSPRAMKLVPTMLLINYGWPHEEAGKKYPKNEMSFRQTIGCLSRSDRGFKVVIDREEQKVKISFDSKSVSSRHAEWLTSVKNRTGLKDLDPQPYWGFDDLYHKAGTKLLNCFFVRADVKIEGGKEYYQYDEIKILQKFTMDRFLSAMERGFILVDFDARTGHNHGTKFRIKQNSWPELYEIVKDVE
ncbi:MAG: MvaI/BcnI family restriction endonuclease [Candidatus Bathyarchaeia archaeon]